MVSNLIILQINRNKEKTNIDICINMLFHKTPLLRKKHLAKEILIKYQKPNASNVAHTMKSI